MHLPHFSSRINSNNHNLQSIKQLNPKTIILKALSGSGADNRVGLNASSDSQQQQLVRGSAGRSVGRSVQLLADSLITELDHRGCPLLPHLSEGFPVFIFIFS